MCATPDRALTDRGRKGGAAGRRYGPLQHLLGNRPMTAIDIFLDRIESNGIIVGTNNAGDIPLDTTFTELVKIHVDLSSGASTSTALWSTSINLRLVDAIIYRKSVQIIPRGWSAGLRLDGWGIEAIAGALKSKRKGEFLHLRVGNEA